MNITKQIAGLALGLMSAGLSLSAQNIRVDHSSYLSLNGKDQYLRVEAHPDFDIKLGESYSYTFWMYASRSMIHGEAQRIFSRHDSSHPALDSLNRSGYEVMVARTMSNNFIGANLSSASGNNKPFNAWLASPDIKELYTWYHCAIVIDRAEDKIKIYLDQQLIKTIDGIRDWSVSNKFPLFIGAGQSKGQAKGHFFGRIDNLRFYKKALQASELVQDAKTEQINPQSEGLIAAFDFDGLRAGATSYTDETGRYTAQLNGYPVETQHQQIKSYTAHRTNGHLVGRANNQALSVFSLGLNAEEQIESVRIATPEVSHLKNVLRYRLYLTDNGDRYDNRKPATLLAEGKPALGTTTLRSVKNAPKISKYSQLWLVADISPKAEEGAQLPTKVESIKLKGSEPFAPQSEAYKHEIVLQRVLLWAPSENHSAHYRIPSMVKLNNGHLVAAIDRRKATDYDLPSNIDVEVKISQDNGRSWSKPITVAKGSSDYGYGDAAITTDGKNIYMVMVAGSGLWYYPSSAKKPLDMYFTKSTDGGKTWSPVVDITKQVYTDRYPNGGFFGSGNGIITSQGRIAFVAAMRTEAKWGGNMDNVMVYSDDQGKTWHSSAVARTNGDESKILELSNGDLLISSRNRASNTPRTYILSTDHGKTWGKPQQWTELVGNACNAALTRYSHNKEGKGSEDIILHTLLASPTRDHLMLYMSRDEGQSWETRRMLCDGEAAYSEVTRLKNGNIGIISEEDDRPAYDIYFTEVSLDWLRKGERVSKSLNK